MLTFYDAIKAISPFSGTSADTVLGWGYLEIFHKQLQGEGLTISSDSALTWKDERQGVEYKNEHPASIQKCQPKPPDNYKFYIINRTTLNLMTFLLKTASVIMFMVEFF